MLQCCLLNMAQQFVPIPRTHAAGAMLVPRKGSGAHVSAVRGLDAAKRELRSMLVETRLPSIGTDRSALRDAEYLFVRHPSTSMVESALAHLATNVAIELA